MGSFGASASHIKTTGFVVSTSEKPTRTGGKMYGLKIAATEAEAQEGGGTWVSTFKRPDSGAEGDFITFSYTKKGDYLNLVDGSIVVDATKKLAKPVAQSGSSGGGKGGGGYDPMGQTWGNTTKQATDIVLAWFHKGLLPAEMMEVKGLDAFIALQHEVAVSLFFTNKDIPELPSHESPVSSDKDE